MPDKSQPGVGEAHETTRGGERVLIRPARPDDVALYPDFLADVGPEDLRLRFHARIAELSGAERDRLFRLDQRHEMAFVALDEDTGRMLGPHGGLLDRLDAVLFTIVAGYYLSLAIVY